MNNYCKTPLLSTLKRYKSLGFEYVDLNNINKVHLELSKLPDNLEELHGYIDSCSLCNLSKQRYGYSHFKGDIGSKIWVVGKTPTYYLNKDIYNIFNNMIQNTVINTSNICLTSIIKCNTNTINNDYQNEVKICSEYLFKQIQICKPKIIITLGDAYNIIMNKNESIYEISGNVYKLNQATVIPIYDPIFLMKNPSYKEKVYSDLEKIKIHLR